MTDVAATDPSVPALARLTVLAGPTAVGKGTVVTELRERLDRGAEITWVQDGTRHVHSTHSPERFVKELDLDHVTGLTITRPTLEETYLSLVSSKEPQS